jgi:hypothetical protein
VTYRKTIVCFLVIFFIFLAFSIFFFVAVSNVVEVRRQYYAPQNSNCTIGTSCNVSFTIPFTMTQPVYFMYELGTRSTTQATSIKTTEGTSKARATTNWLETMSLCPKRRAATPSSLIPIWANYKAGMGRY